MSDDWLDEDDPLEPEIAGRQEAALRRLLEPPPRRVLELGCGSGRVLVPLAAAGHAVTGLDRDRPRLERCRAVLRERGAAAMLHEVDFLDAAPWPGAPFDAVLCLGNTLMTIVEPAAALGLLRRVAAALRPGGLFVADDVPGLFWPQVTGGNWQNGVSEDGRWQMAWAPDDAVFTVREGDAVDPDVETPQPGERTFRLWTAGLLGLLADLAGLSGSGAPTGEGLLIMRAGEG